MLKKIVLYGDMGRKFGKYWHLDVRTPIEAIRGIVANKPEFEDYLLDGFRNGMGLRVFVGHEVVTDKVQLTAPFSYRETMRLVPEVGGSGGAFSAIVGVILLFVPGMQTMGVSLLLSGVASLLADKPAAPSASSQEEDKNKPSFNFDGVVNTTKQGHCVPLCYGGPIIVGSASISAGVTTVDVDIAPTPPTQPPPQDQTPPADTGAPTYTY